MKSKKSEEGIQYRNRYSVDLSEYEEVILKLATKEKRGKANMVRLLLQEALTARGEII